MKNVVAALALLISVSAHAQSFSYEGRAFDSSGNPLTASSVSFRLTIRPPGYETCRLYSELHTLDLSATNGFFTLSVGSGSLKTFASATPNFSKVFSNATSISLNSIDCGTTQTYAPNTTDGRNLFVEISTDGSNFEALPKIAIGSVPYAIEAQQVAGFGADQLLRVDPGVTGTTHITQAMLTELNALISGSSSQYITPATLRSYTPSSLSSLPGSNITLSAGGGTNSVVINGSVPSVSSTTGSLVVSGGMGVSGNINASGSIQTLGIVAGSTIQATGALKTSAGTSSAPSLQVGSASNGLFAPTHEQHRADAH